MAIGAKVPSGSWLMRSWRTISVSVADIACPAFCEKECHCSGDALRDGFSPGPNGTLAAPSSFIVRAPYSDPNPPSIAWGAPVTCVRRSPALDAGAFSLREMLGGRAAPSYLRWCKLQIMTASSEIQVEVQGPNLIVTAAGFCAVYYKPKDQPQLILRLRSRSDDYELLARVWMAANNKARELGWIA